MNTIRDKRIFNTYPNSLTTTPYPTVYTSITNDTTVIVPLGYVLEFMTFLNATANTATLSLGITAGGTEIFTGQTVEGSGTNYGLTTFSLNYDAGITAQRTLYLHDNAPGDSWNSANVTIYLVLRKIV